MVLKRKSSGQISRGHPCGDSGGRLGVAVVAGVS